MKNSEEFRRLVFEKAEAYQKRRRARNQKIAGSMITFALIFALTLPISLHLYHQNAQPAEETTSVETMASTTAAVQTTALETLFTAKEDTTYATTTTRAETTMEWTYHTTSEETIKPEPTTTVMMTTTETSTTETTTWVPDISWTTTKPEPPSTTTSEEAAKPVHLLGDHQITGFCRYEHFIEYYHGKRVLVEMITSEDDLLRYLEDHTSLYGGDIMDALNVYDVDFFREYDLLIIESPHRIRDITVESDKLLIRLNEGMSGGSRLNLIVMGKTDTFFIESVWH